MKYFLFLSFLCPNKSFAQQLIEGKVTDNKHVPLHYVSVGIIGTPYGTVSDITGHFIFSFEKTANSDSIRFSMLGFRSQTFELKSYVKNSAQSPVILEPAPVEIREVVVRPAGNNQRTLGNKNTTASMNVNFSIPGQPEKNLGSEIGRKFKISKPTYIEKISFYLSANDYDTVSFRINIYSEEKGLPAANLLEHPLLIQVCDRKREWITTDLEEHGVITDRDVIITIEWVGASEKGSSLAVPITVPSLGAVHYYKFGSQNRWKVFSNMSSCMNIQVSD